MRSNSSNTPNNRTRTSSVLSFPAFFTQFCSPLVPPKLFEGTFKEATAEGLRQEKCILLYLHCDEHSQTDYFCLFDFIICCEAINYFNCL